MQDPTQAFIMKQFRKYYKTEDIEVPDRLARREFGFMFFDKNFVLRHIGFRTKGELKEYLSEHTPSHAYYSSAYYQKPGAQTMVEKEWMGADLVFDLDADHVKGAENLSYPDMLRRVKTEIIRLIDEFISGDLGFDVDKLKIVFSGGRGYHVHINDPRVLKLGGHERREVVDYITGTDLNFDWVFPEKAFEAKHFANRTQVIDRIEMPSIKAGGWKARMATGIDRFLIDLEVMGREEAVKRFSTLKDPESGRSLGEKAVSGMYMELYDRKGAQRIRKERNLEVFSKQTYLTAFLMLAEEHVKLSVVGETDEPVTSDVKRLIRLPSSLHGKTGLRVTTLGRDELNDFDPLRDGVPDFLTDRPVKIESEIDFEIRIKDEVFRVPKGDSELPEFAALFAVCRKMAKIDA